MSKRLSKTQLIAAMAEKWGISKKDASEMYDKLIELIYGEVKRCGEIMLPGLGKMAKKHRAERMGRNPATGETIKIPAKTVVKFAVNKAAKDALL
ncbi:MAG: Histone family protein DNA-binding protein [uncultured bacterium]|uniref:Viral histone-like protein n=1 Tax=Candidatus Uhrbacteria bacterium GW2011_GWC1_41_20 TaxID=1618983 RepID=A0A0G0XN19_9BACT|nr:MAG: Histone family protein DNA-binding protein [uncultured bacterium]KKR21621.1 MAG: Histone family protein DNA-binding protein [Candidatus Uhrbacteria bacterium GW2011_GWE1_39_46]KKR63137.1 MAG: Histone family protein DNA-binding protein [Candidatus Uhrbacteria bacterium GW2011_GWC2_40_450]KKR94449.1 MAG: Histone family protein DNA-binding protein [Candidatus Uhrbacteria bacterium GW2011_GWD1_41_16]KKR98195.1 MAG: Histone family protein DNA-binding protein [Candidatus Uhrbacteria bacterium